ncbi:PAS domain-containing hybrid sensor histidine kinase/response regulator [Roseateles oligotrophus]|uniref:histidine kinase n=1 Tax=Roseateles oligotrophus TaxID=1769250 RepID=A0ABT2YME3_9BURK|nr:PAS domain-containing hybrid sensor histidine kinase/response regulator [Roseateles oligotrophus]MCV2371239.1 response regulator [Roseateles oligotrophus]
MTNSVAHMSGHEASVPGPQPLRQRLVLRLQSLSIALIVSVLLSTVITVVLSIFAWFFYQSERAARIEQLHRTIELQAKQLVIALQQPVWGYDETQIHSLLLSGMNNVNLLGIEVRSQIKTGQEQGQRLYQIGRDEQGIARPDAALAPTPELLTEQHPILIDGKEIAKVSLFASYRFVHQELRERRNGIFAGIIVLDLTLVGAVYLLLRSLMLLPIKRIELFAAAIRSGAGETDRRSEPIFFGELKALDQSIRAMTTLLDRRLQETRAVEERLKMATRAASLGIWDWNIQTNVQLWDDAMYSMYRLSRTSFDGSYQSWLDTLLPEDRQATMAAFDKALAGDYEYEGEFRITRPDGSLRHLRSAALIFRDADGRAIRMVGVSQDISERKTAEIELEQHRHHLQDLVLARTSELSVAMDAAYAANRAKSIFLATMSHELRTPLNSVIGFSRMMAESRSMSPDDKRNLELIHLSGKHLLHLINDILELSKIEAGRTQLRPTLTGLPQILREVCDLIGVRAREKGLTLSLRTEGLPAHIRIDPDKLRQVLLNLLSNAVKFVEQGSIELSVSFSPAGDGHGLLKFDVIDTGFGISAADIEHIFEPFVQVQGPHSSEGTGLGLSISRQFVRLMGGELSVQSQAGLGSTFSFTLPVELGELNPGPAPAAWPLNSLDSPTALTLARPPHFGQGRRVLLVDDLDEGRRLLRAILEPLDFKLSEAADGRQALEAVALECPDLVLMDLHMPGMNGLEVIREIRRDAQLQAQPRIVMVTATAFDEQRMNALAAGADDFLVKPLDQDALFAVLEDQLGLQASSNEHQLIASSRRSLSSGDLARLAPEQRQQLRRGLQELDRAQVDGLLQELAARSPADADLSSMISEMLAHYQHPELCALIDALEQQGTA